MLEKNKCFILFNSKLEQKWGGNLELWDKNNKKKIIEIEPLFNRIVILNTTSNSFHGQPIPISTPKNIFRNVFSAFYYSYEKDKETFSEPHFTRYSIDNNPYAKQISEDYKKL